MLSVTLRRRDIFVDVQRLVGGISADEASVLPPTSNLFDRYNQHKVNCFIQWHGTKNDFGCAEK